MAGEIIGQGDIAIGANTAEFDKAMQEIPRKAGRAQEEAGKKTESAWAKAAKSIQRSSLVSEMETIAAIGIQAGGTVSQVASVVTSLIRPVAIATQVLGPMGLAIGGAGLAATGTALALRSLASSAVELGGEAGEAGERLQRLGLLAAEDRRWLEDLAAATDAVAVANDRATIAMARAIPQVTLLTEAYTGLRAGTADAWRAVGDFEDGLGDSMREVQRSIPIVGGFLEKMTELAGPGGGNVGVIPGVNLALKILAERGREASDELEQARRSAAALASPDYGPSPDLNPREAFVGPSPDDADPLGLLKEREAAAKAAADAAREAARAHEEAERAATRAAEQGERAAEQGARAWKRYQGDLDSAIDGSEDMIEALREMEGTVNLYLWEEGWRGIELQMNATTAGVDAQRAALEELKRAWEDATAKAEQEAEDTKERLKDLGVDALSFAETTANSLVEVWQRSTQEQLDAATRKVDDIQSEEARLNGELESLQQQRAEATTVADQMAIDSQIEATQAELDNLRQREEGAKKAALGAWKANQRSQAAAIPINAAAAFGITLATTPGFPFNLIAAGIASAAVFSAGIPILTQSPPEFPTGLSPDHHLVGVQHGEPILSRRANAELEARLGPDAADRLNRGQPLGGGGVTHVYLGRKLIGVAVAATATRPVDPRLGKGRRR